MGNEYEKLKTRIINDLVIITLDNIPISLSCYNYDEISFLVNNNLIVLPQRWLDAYKKNNDFSFVHQRVDFCITAQGLSYIDDNYIIQELDKRYLPIAKKQPQRVSENNFIFTRKCTKEYVDSVRLFFTLKDLSITYLCSKSNGMLNFPIVYDDFDNRKIKFEEELYKLIPNYSLKSLGDAIALVGHDFPINDRNWRNIIFQTVNNYILKNKVKPSETSFELNNLLVGNGLSIGLTNGRYFTNKRLISAFADDLFAEEKAKTYKLVEFINFFLFQYLTENDVRDFYYSRHSQKTLIMEQSRESSNRYLYLFNKFFNNHNPIVLEDIGIEDLEIFEDVYNEFKAECIFSMPNTIIDYKKHFYNIVKNEESMVKTTLLLNRKLLENVTIFSTNYDSLLENNLDRNNIIHLHGDVAHNNIITASNSNRKVSQITNSNNVLNWDYALLDNKDFYRLQNITGCLGIVGYSSGINDEHINELIRECIGIKKIIYFYHEELNEMEKQRIVKFLTIYKDEKTIEFRNVNEFYTKYSA